MQTQAMSSRSFLPSPRATNVLVAIGLISLCYAMYVRYMLNETSAVALECDAGLAATRCTVRSVSMFLFKHQLFGIAALALAALHLFRPNLYVFACSLALTGLGLVLYNNGLAAIAFALLVVSFARPVAASMPPSEEEGAPRTTAPASSRASR
jgi:hypothetical protein